MKRFRTVDLAKGFGIALVVVGHNRVFREDLKEIYFSIYLFHMPLFFLLSGLVGREIATVSELSKKVWSLLKPYLAGCLLFLPLQLMKPDHPSNDSVLGKIAWASGNSIYNSPLWFLVALAVGYVFLWIKDKFFKDQWMDFCLAIVIVGLYYFALDRQMFFDHLPVDRIGRPLGAPLNLDLGLLVMAILIIGRTGKNLLSMDGMSRFSIFLLPVVLIAFVFVFLTYEPRLDLNYRYIQVAGAALACAFLGCVAVFMFSAIIDAYLQKSRLTELIAFIGQNTLIIFIFHSVIQSFLLRALERRVEVNAGLAVGVSLVVLLALAVASEKIVNRFHLLRTLFYVK